MGKQRKWSSEENVATCRAFTCVSVDSIVGSNQSSGKLEVRVCDAFQSPVPETVRGQARVVWLARTPRSIVRRYKTVKTACLKYSSKRPIVDAAQLTGFTPPDLEAVTRML